MNHKRTISIITSLLILSAATILAHGGFDHVQGTVVSVDKEVLTVKTAKGNSAVRLNAKTEITKNDKSATVADLTPGTRVVVDIPEGDKEKTAHSVKIGTAGKAKATTESHEHDHK